VEAGIGWDKAAKLFYRTETTYLSSSSNFASVAKGNLSAANDLGFTQDEKNIIQCAWIAVGVITSPSSCQAITGNDGTGNNDGNGSGGGDGNGGGSGSGNTGGNQGVGPSDDQGNGQDALGGKSASCSASTSRGAGNAYQALMLALAGALFMRRRRRSTQVAKTND